MAYNHVPNLPLSPKTKKCLKKFVFLQTSDILKLINWNIVDKRLYTLLRKQFGIMKREIRKKS